jgi:GntR family phosphonate transport system transcriptional regulator
MADGPPRRTPLFAAIARQLRDEIAEGRFTEGARLPTEARLAARFGVNRHTVRHAIATLVSEGLVHTRRGSGAYVLARPIDYPLGDRVRFHQSLEAAGRFPDKRILSVETHPATEDDAHRLALPPGADVTVSHTVSFADGTPVALAESRFPEHRLPGLADALRAETSVTRALAAVGVADYTRASTRLSARTATATEALHLKLPEGAPILFAVSINVDGEGRPVEYGQTWFAGDRITLTVDKAEI